MSEIFLFDVFVSHLRLRPEIIQDAGKTTFIVKINFNNVPPVEIRENVSSPKILSDNSFDYLFYGGGIQYFPMKTTELVKLIEKSPLKIGVYREGDSFPLCQVQIPLFGCDCNLVSIGSEEKLSKVLSVDGPFNLLDPGKNFSGKIYINVALAKCGRFIDSHYYQQKQSFLFKNSLEGSEYECFRVSEDLKVDPDSLEKISEIDWSCNFQEVVDNFIKDLIVILPSSQHLSVEKKPSKTAHISLDETESPTRKKKKTSKGKKKK